MHVEGCYHNKLRQLSSGAARSEASTVEGGPWAPLEGKTQRRPAMGPTRGGSTRNDGHGGGRNGPPAPQ